MIAGLGQVLDIRRAVQHTNRLVRIGGTLENTDLETLRAAPLALGIDTLRAQAGMGAQYPEPHSIDMVLSAGTVGWEDI